MAGLGGDEDDIRCGIDFGRGKRGGGAGVAKHEAHTFCNERLRRLLGLVARAAVVGGFDF